MGIQTITTPAGEEMVVMPRAEYETLITERDTAFEDGADAATFAAAMAELSPEDVLPADLTAAILAGKGRLRAFREWRGLELQQLALESGLAEARLEQLEAGEILLSRDDAGRLSEALALPIGWLVA